MSTQPGPATPKPDSTQKRIIINVCAGLGIIGGIVARRLLQIEGVLPGALFGAGGALLGLLIGVVIAKVLVKE